MNKKTEELLLNTIKMLVDGLEETQKLQKLINEYLVIIDTKIDVLNREKDDESN
jgi:hypothetical protein